MNTFYPLEPKTSVIKLLQITDPHLFSDTTKDLLGVNTHASFQAVLDEIQAEIQTQAVEF